ncbi:putative CRISPR-associated protein [Aceticella autotrophica]|uniref:CRISPR-associated protein n=1 Tax=Aceticella autotrophica TaxID=2755338 RepID=A0A975AW58_9THEO|nr:putative CRISPR-associated protein [Aceticella autotrophica]QSZ27586.1 putative CRISPR-associated protein [Aceticella autotrophica]
MKKIITMVGTSIFDNYKEKNNDNKNFSNNVEYLKDKGASEYDKNKEMIEAIIKDLKDWIKKEKDKENISAEIKSLVKLKKELNDDNDDLDIYLLYSDTILGKIAGEVVKEFIIADKEMFGNIQSNGIKCYMIKNLQVKDRKKFEEGMNNLIYKVYDLTQEDWNNVAINITGGFKATIPYLTVLGQVNKCPIYYIFEKTDVLIKIPYIPLDIKWNVFEENEEFFVDLERKDISELPNNLTFRNDIESLIEKADNLLCINSLGITLWEKYKERFELFYISIKVKDYIDGTKDKKQIIDSSFLELKRRLKENPQDPDLDHKLEEVNLQGFKCFKHKEKKLQVRILYKTEERKTRYGSKELDIFIEDIEIGSGVHNANNEYVKQFKKILSEISDLDKYKCYRIEKAQLNKNL